MSAQEYGYWTAAYAAEPWGDDRMDLGMGIIASTLANVHRRQGAQPFVATDFAPFLRAQQERDNPSTQAAATPAQFLKELGHG